MQTYRYPAVEQNTNIKWSKSSWNQSVSVRYGKEFSLWTGGNDLPKSHVLSSEWKTERVRENASGDREDGEEDDDELPCLIGLGESEGDCVWRGSRVAKIKNSVGTGEFVP